LGLSQITRTTPFRLIILHFSQIAFTDGLTFIALASSVGILLMYCFLLETVRDAPAAQIVWRQLHGDTVSRQNPYKIHANLAGHMRQYFMPIGELDLEHSVGQWLDDRSLDFDHILL
jgi:hypothetical protein